MMSTESAASKEFARNTGRDNSDCQWILSPYDCWEINPFYTGVDQRHPEDDEDEV